MPNNIYNELEKFSMETWEKITSITPLTTYMKINEEGFTLDLVYMANRVDRSFVILDGSIQDQEPETGADFFWNIRCNGEEHKLAIQAKRSMKPKSNYKGIKNKIDNVTQIDRLMQYAHRIGYEPYYFFYNGWFEETTVNVQEYLHTDDVYLQDYQNGNPDLSKLGCTVLAAEHVNEINMDGPRFDRITKVPHTRSLQQFFRELCPSCSLDGLMIYETLDDRDKNLGGNEDNPDNHDDNLNERYNRYKYLDDHDENLDDYDDNFNRKYDKDENLDDKYEGSKEFLFKEVEEKYYVMRSKGDSVDDNAINKALKEYKSIKRKTENLNKDSPRIKYGTPQAILFTNY